LIDGEKFKVFMEELSLCDMVFSKRQLDLVKEWKDNNFSYFIKVNTAQKLEPVKLKGDNYPRRLRIAEAVLKNRTNRFVIVLERCLNPLNQQAVLRTAECLGVMEVWIILDIEQKVNISKKKLQEEMIFS